MSLKNAKIISCITIAATLVGSFIIIGREAIFGDALLSEIDFTYLFIILVSIVPPNIFMFFIKKDKK